MSRVVLRQAIALNARTTLILAAVVGFFFWVVFTSSSTFLANLEEVPPIFAEPPRAMRAFLGGAGNFLEPDGWLATGLFHPIILTLLTAAAVMVPAGTGVAELERGTLDLVLVRPVTRRSYLIAKAVATMLAVTVVVMGGLLGTLISRLVVEGVDRIPVADILLVFLGQWILFLAIGAVALLGFARAALRSRALGFAIGSVVASFFVNFVANLFDATVWMRFLTPFFYFKPAGVLGGETFVWHWLVLIGFGAAATAAALRVFERRDL